MRHKSGRRGTASQKLVKDIRRATRKHYSAEEKIRIVLEDALEGACSKGVKGWKQPAQRSLRELKIEPGDLLQEQAPS